VLHASTSRTDRRLLPAAAALLALLCTQATALGAAASGDVVRGSSWGAVSSGLSALDPGLPTVGDGVQKVIVTARGGVSAAADAVRRFGGTVHTPLPLVEGVSATVPASQLVDLAGTPSVTGVSADRTARFEDLTYDGSTTASNFAKSTQATVAWAEGNVGAGIGIAVLDTGVSQMNDFQGRLVHGPDLSGEGTVVDSYGHGTVMAGVAAGGGQDSAGSSKGAITGVAPRSTVVAVKVAGRNGAVDVSTILQGMHWVLAYKDQFNIRVLNLSWGTTSTQDPAVDPLNYAVQRLWQSGIVVVVSAGNAGPGRSTITKPADDPLVISVGAYDDKADTDLRNDGLATWSSRGPTLQGLSKPDLVVPGRTLVAVRSFGSKVEADNPKALVAPSYIKGSGTSQAAAVTSGLAALLIAKNPALTPDQVKRVLTSTAAPLGAGGNNEGAGRTQLARALAADPGPASWQTPTASGLGSLEGSRGGRNVETVCPGTTTPTVIRGEIDARCEEWNGSAWTGSAWTGSAWTGSAWTGSAWTGSAWTGSAWTGSAWTGSAWTGGTWAGSAWTGSAWTGSAWTGSAWTGSAWTGSAWTGSAWTGNEFTAAEYGEDEFLTAWWGSRPPRHKPVKGEPSELPDRDGGV
jgi:serine protease AprX